MKKFTFKTEHPTGRYRSFEKDLHIVKYNKVEVGTISDDKPCHVKLRVIKGDILEDGNVNCEWKWVTLKKDFSSVQEAKDFLNQHVEEIHAKVRLVTTD